MSQYQCSEPRKQKWYNSNIFPLIPVLEIRKANEHNSSGFTLRWLFLTVWSLDNIYFEVSFVISTHWGIGFIGLLPYLRWVISIPVPEKVGYWINKKTSRFYWKKQEKPF